MFLVNHPRGGLDGLGMLAWALDRYRTVRMLANDVLVDLPHLRPFLVPVDRFGGGTSVVRDLQEVFAGDEPVVVFPAGRTARLHGGVLVDPPWHRTAVTLALRHRRPVVPLFIHGRNSRHFYAGIPPILRSYLGLGNGFWFGQTAFDDDFAGALEVGIVVPLATVNRSRATRSTETRRDRKGLRCEG